ncbi:MAG: hypothetical protein FWH12_04940 [Treponema sp.]|nr:hypothetical protein [Treponema sp.]
MDYVIGIDSGSTKYLIKARSLDGQILGQVKGPTANHRIIGTEKAGEAIKTMVTELLSSFGAAPGDCRCLVAAAAGIDSEQDRAAVQALYGVLGLSCPLFCMNDAMAALYAATQGQGVLSISGTGSIAVGRNSQGRITRSGGHPTSIFGDEGSSRWMALMAMRHASRWIDGMVPPSALTDKLDSFFGGLDANKLSQTAARYKQSPVETELAVLVYEAAKEGDQGALEIIQQGARELFDLALSCVHKLSLDQDPSFKSGVWGSVFVENHFFYETYRDLFLKAYPQCQVVFPQGDAADGALDLAADYLEGKIPFIGEL